MKKSITTAIFLLFVCFAMSAQKTRCSYFITFNWGCSYPGQFAAQFHPSDQSLTVTPVPGSFGGIVSVAVFDNINCGNPPLCTHQFKKPVTATASIPSAWYACALGAQPLFIRICWMENSTE
ncbi:MAG: hypothetical protein K9J37_13620 [Saprospiraceae bacterium]|nr:hypothetical protein [Saprospiraceae bacterium]MCF8250948.1 hypothetical protein [Saprospiraceae bacterium]MCF8281925.1 hypothetical protein [Bacteroidales bacterium]MCF8311912.1 hypothetical protein [Saprospiraceae bacterium]MCF8441920.1 hypothetical protein [Saprospiraceae bacterium]